MSAAFKLIECPRDAMQGLKNFVPTDLKAAYINQLLKVGFDTIDFGSFVSPKAIPQMADTEEVLSKLDLSQTNTKLLAIVANIKGVERALEHQEIDYLGFPFSISETFQQRNTNSSIAESIATVKEMLELCDKANTKTVLYLSMGFGNPYGDEWSEEIVEQYVNLLVQEGAKIISLSDTTGVSTPNQITKLIPPIIKKYNQIEIGVHLHAKPFERFEKINAAYLAGVKRIDGAINGFGGCPMADDTLTGNLATEDIIKFLSDKGENLNLNQVEWEKALQMSSQIF